MKEVVFNEQNICLAEKRPLISGINLSRWCFKNGNVVYENPSCDTLSLSLKGGSNTYRGDNHIHHAGPNSICIMPKSHKSFWHVQDEIKFAHFYIERKMFTEFAAIHLDKETRGFALRDLTYFSDNALSDLMKKCLEPHLTNLGYEQLSYTLLNHLLMYYTDNNFNRTDLIGGLSPLQRKRVLDFINDNLSLKITIESMSKEVNLSPYHFAREFKHSFSLPPAQFILRKRLLKAKSLLQTSTAISDISNLCGFSTQSHMNVYFKKVFNLTPAAYRSCLASR